MTETPVSRRLIMAILAVVVALSIVAINVPTQLIRTFIAKATSLDYLYGTLLALGLLFALLFPKFRGALVPADDGGST